MTVTAMALVVTACGGAVEAGVSDTGIGPDEVAVDAGDDTFTVTADGGEVVVGSSDRPEWLPGWVLLPDGLEITTAFSNPGVGESAVMGSLAIADPQTLYDDAKFMVQSVGYVIGEEYQTSGLGFNADHTSDGSRLIVSVVQVSEDFTLWSMEFFDEAGDGDGDQQVGDEPSTSRPDASAVMTVTVGAEVFDVIGRCTIGDGHANFSADDSFSVFDVFSMESGELGAVGNATLVVDGERTTSWSVDLTLDAVALELSDTSIFYEGKIRENTFGSDSEIGTVAIDCG